MLKNVLILFLSLSAWSCQPDGSKISVDSEEQTNSLETATLNKGQEISQLAFKQLSTVLKQKMKEGGVVNAVDFCNVNASLIMDSIATLNEVRIKRVTKRFRNPANAPDSLETSIIESYEDAIAKKESVEPLVVNDGVNMRYFAPIYTKALCLSCHGTPGQHISGSDYQFILSKYPNDQAIEYSTNELRGIWSISF